jgi:hypothetical protein
MAGWLLWALGESSKRLACPNLHKKCFPLLHLSLARSTHREMRAPDVVRSSLEVLPFHCGAFLWIDFSP